MTEAKFTFEYSHSGRVGGLVGNREFFEELLFALGDSSLNDALCSPLIARLDDALNSPPPRPSLAQQRLQRKTELGRMLHEQGHPGGAVTATQPTEPPLGWPKQQCYWCGKTLVEVDNPMRAEFRHRRGEETLCPGPPIKKD